MVLSFLLLLFGIAQSFSLLVIFLSSFLQKNANFESKSTEAGQRKWEASRCNESQKMIAKNWTNESLNFNKVNKLRDYCSTNRQTKSYSKQRRNRGMQMKSFKSFLNTIATESPQVTLSGRSASLARSESFTNISKFLRSFWKPPKQIRW